MNKKIKTEAVDHLFDAILTLKDPEECYKFFEDVCTINELLSLSQRYEVAKMLREGKTYLEIAEKTGASTATISRVNRALTYGTDGYKLAIERVRAQKEKEEQEQDFLRSHVPVLLLLFPRKIHDRRFMVNGREKFFENIGCFDLQAAGVDAWMAAERFVL